MNGGYSWTNTSQWSNIPNNAGSQTGSIPSNTVTPTQPNSSQQAISQHPTASQPSQPMNSTSSMNPPESRRDMITRLYRQLLGRDPDTAGLNYYLFNSNITEAQIVREMYESTEHQSLINRSKDVREMIQKLEDYSRENNELKTKLLNSESLTANYKILLDQKTQMINSLKSGQVAQNIDNQHPKTIPNQQVPTYSGSSEGLVLEDPFAEQPEKGKGCVGWIKNLFSFS